MICYPAQTQETVRDITESVKKGELPSITVPSDVSSLIDPAKVIELVNTAITTVMDLYNSLTEATSNNTEQSSDSIRDKPKVSHYFYIVLYFD